ncbi:PQQ-binding-like beta-propeller repeat protein [Haloarcula argentinensis]
MEVSFGGLTWALPKGHSSCPHQRWSVCRNTIRLYSLTRTGETRWQFDITSATTPTVGTDTVYVGGFRNQVVFAVNREDGMNAGDITLRNTSLQQPASTVRR